MEYFLIELRNAKGKQKLQILEKYHRKFPEVKKYLKYTLDPFLTYNISTLKIEKVGKEKLESFQSFFALLDLCNKRLLTGNEAREKLSNYIEKYNAQYQDLLMCCLTKDLKANISIKSVNRVFIGLIPEFCIQLAEKYKAITRYPVYAEPKLDGIRIIAICKKQDISLYTRNGHLIVFPTIENELANLNFDSVVLDGEVIGITFQRLMQQVHRKYNRTDETLQYQIFDILDYNDFLTKKNEIRYLDRKQRIENIDSKILKYVPYIKVSNSGELSKVYEELSKKYEGIIVKRNSEYQFRRTSDWIKMKPENTMDCKVVKVVLGQGKYANQLGAIEVIQENGKRCFVGSGFSDEQRTDYSKNKKKIEGKVVEIKYQELTEDGIMRFPIFKHIRIDK